MEHLAHWDFMKEFSGYDAAALILGLEPRESEFNEHRVRVVMARMEHDFINAFNRAESEHCEFLFDQPLGDPPSGMLISVQLEKLWRDFSNGIETPFSEWLADRRQRRFENQVFDRTAIVEWLKAIEMKSAYRFDLSRIDAPTIPEADKIDPADLPEELHAANIAFRAVTLGFGNPSATVRNRLIEYLKEHFKDFGDEAVQRIATVANPDKAPGRRKITT